MDESFLTWLPSSSELPAALPSPFDEGPVHPLARSAAEALLARLRAGSVPGLEAVRLETRREGGKMFGVLVVRTGTGRLGGLQAFSGQLGYSWTLPGFVPPLFDAGARARLEAASDTALHELTARLDALRTGALQVARDALATFDAGLELERRALKARLTERKHARRSRSASAPAAELDAESRADTLTARAEEARWKAERAPLQATLDALHAERTTLEATRAQTSRTAMKDVFDTYRLRNARGEERLLRTLFPRGEPPWGAGDCAAPKLLGYAVREGLTPLALAEFWWGPPPPGGGRAEGRFYPSCREKCGPILPFLLEGLEVAPPSGLSRQTESLTLHADALVRVTAGPAQPQEGWREVTGGAASGLRLALAHGTVLELARVAARYLFWLEADVTEDSGHAPEGDWRRAGPRCLALRLRPGAALDPSSFAARLGTTRAHLEWLRFPHPRTGQLLEFTSPAPL